MLELSNSKYEFFKDLIGFLLDKDIYRDSIQDYKVDRIIFTRDEVPIKKLITIGYIYKDYYKLTGTLNTYLKRFTREHFQIQTVMLE